MLPTQATLATASFSGVFLTGYADSVPTHLPPGGNRPKTDDKRGSKFVLVVIGICVALVVIGLVCAVVMVQCRGGKHITPPSAHNPQSTRTGNCDSRNGSDLDCVTTAAGKEKSRRMSDMYEPIA